VFKRALTVGLILTLAAALHAQQQTPASAGSSAPPTPEEASRKVQVQYYERLLESSVVAASLILADKARQVVPGIQLTPSNNPAARGWWSPGIGYQYYVELPEFQPTQVLVLSQQMRGGTRIVGGGGANQNVGQTGQSTVTQGDPMTQTPVRASTTLVDLGDVYRDAVYEKLYDIILDNSGGLPIKDDELLQVVSAPAPSLAPLIYPDSRKLILQIRGADLRAYHEHKITKDEAKQKIVETRF